MTTISLHHSYLNLLLFAIFFFWLYKSIIEREKKILMLNERLECCRLNNFFYFVTVAIRTLLSILNKKINIFNNLTDIYK